MRVLHRHLHKTRCAQTQRSNVRTSRDVFFLYQLVEPVPGVVRHAIFAAPQCRNRRDRGTSREIARVSFDDAREETEAISTASCAVNYRSAGERRQRRKCADDLGIHPHHFERIPGRGLGQRRSLRGNGRCLDTCACAESCRENRQTRKSPTLHYPSQDRQARLPSRDYARPASPAQGISPRNSPIPPGQSAGDAPRPP